MFGRFEPCSKSKAGGIASFQQFLETFFLFSFHWKCLLVVFRVGVWKGKVWCGKGKMAGVGRLLHVFSVCVVLLG